MLHEAVEVSQTVTPVMTAIQTARAHDLILRELNHRVANTLTILQASCRHDFAGVSDPELAQGLRCHELRIRRLAEFHHFLSRGAGRGPIAAADYFRPLCAVLSRSVLEPLGLHCEVFVGEGVLDACTCEKLGLVVAELVMNAAKHGFPRRSEGLVRVEIHAPDGMAWCCIVADNGCGMRDAKSGAGSQILDALVQMLDGRMVVKSGPGGTTVSILFAALDCGYRGPE